MHFSFFTGKIDLIQGTHMKKKIKDLRKLRELKNAAGGEDKIKKRHLQGKMTGRERVEYFLIPVHLLNFRVMYNIGHQILAWRKKVLW